MATQRDVAPAATATSVVQARDATFTERFKYRAAPVVEGTFAATGVVARSALIDGPKAFWAAFTAKDAGKPQTRLVVVNGVTMEIAV